MKNKVKRCMKHMKPILEQSDGCVDFKPFFVGTDLYGFGSIKKCFNCRFVK
jgi:hypothetical protein